jgi:hypothetical protein
MLLIIFTYLLVLSLLLFVMIKDRRAKANVNRFLDSPQFWEVYVIGISLVGMCYWIFQSEEIQISNILSLN